MMKLRGAVVGRELIVQSFRDKENSSITNESQS